MSHLIRSYTVCHSVFVFRLRTPSASVDMSKFKDGRVYFINSGLKGLKSGTYLKTATSFLKPCNCAGVGLVTLSRFIATEPCQCPLNTVPKEPEPILWPTIISSLGISQSSLESRQPPCKHTNIHIQGHSLGIQMTFSGNEICCVYSFKVSWFGFNAIAMNTHNAKLYITCLFNQKLLILFLFFRKDICSGYSSEMSKPTPCEYQQHTFS